MDISCKFFDDVDELRLKGKNIEANQRLQDAAKEDPDDCNVYYHWAILAKQQGLLGDAKVRIERSKAIIGLRPAVDELQHELFQLTAITIDHYMIGTSDESASLAISIFDKHLRHRSINDYNDVALRLLFDYYDLRSRLKSTGDERYVVTPNLGPRFFWTLYQQLMQQCRFRDAFYLISRFGLDSDGEDKDSANLMQDMLLYPSLPTSIRALVLMCQFHTMRSSSPPEQWLPHAAETNRLFQSIGNMPMANTVLVKVMTESGMELDLGQKCKELVRIAEVAEEHGSVSLAIQAFHAVEDACRPAQTDLLPEVSSRAASQSEGLMQQAQLKWLELSRRSIALAKRDMTNVHPGRLLAYYEQLLGEVKSRRYTILTVSTAEKLHAACLKLGESQKAHACLDDMALFLPAQIRRAYHIDAFFKDLEEATSIPDEEKAYEELCGEIEAARADVNASKDIDDRVNIVEWLQALQSIYSNLRMTDDRFQASRFIEKCNEAILGFSSSVPLENTDSISYHDTYNKARMHTQNAMMALLKAQGNTTAEMEAEIGTALDLFLEAAASSWCSRKPFTKATCYSQVAMSHTHRWNFRHKPAQSDDFVDADRYLRLALEIHRSHGFLKGQLLVTKALFRLWKDGVNISVTCPGRDAANVLLEVCLDLEQLSALERVDRSALKSLQAITAKQALSDDDAVNEAYEAAIDVLMSRGDNSSVWSWVQHSKSRSVSDALALGTRMPVELSSAIQQDQNLRGMLQREEELLQRLEASPGSNLSLQTELEALRVEMKQNNLLRTVFSLREGRPTTLEALQSVQSKVKGLRSQSQTKTVFVDWFLHKRSEIYCTLATDDSDVIHLESTSPTVKDIEEWKAENFEKRDDQEWTGNAALARLTSLIRPILNVSSPKDLLVICPTGTLHGIPIHAALIDDGTGKSLIERNPVVYTSSMTTFEYGVTRQLDITLPTNEAVKNCFVTVFETFEDGALDEAGEALRDSVYTSFKDLAQKLPNSSAVQGFDVTLERMAKALEADSVSFLGHCSFQPDDYLNQGLVLAEKTGDGASATMTSTLFKASYIFNTKVRASNVMLLACGSATQSHKRGDEPLGITTALLCAGASSVTGTLWKASIGAALAFNKAFQGAMSRERSQNNSQAIHLARVVQEAVCRMKRHPDTKNPLQWANFVLHGSWFLRRSP